MSYYGTGLYEGAGAYTKKRKASSKFGHANSLITTSKGGMSTDVPSFKSSRDETGALTVSHREFVRDIFGNEKDVNFKNRSLNINPGLETTFPWLSQIAANYEEYELRQCIFSFRSNVAAVTSSGNNGQVGTIIMATNYNVSNPSFASKYVMMQYDGAHSAKTTESQLQGVECDPSKLSGAPGKYVRVSPVLTGQDLKQYDHGLFQIASSGLPDEYANQSIGELWVTYTIVLRKPKFFTGLGLGISRDLFYATDDFLVGGAPMLPIFTPNLMTLSKSLIGQQNNIGVTIVPINGANGPSLLPDEETAFNNSYTDRMSANCLLFPASWSGSVAITITCNCKSGLGSPAVRDIAASGNVKLVKDMYGASGVFPTSASATGVTTGYPDGSVFSQASTGSIIEPGCGSISLMDNTDAQFQAITIIHARIAVASDGIDNRIALRYTGLTGAQTTVLSSRIDISEYNHYNNQQKPPVYVDNANIQRVPQI